MIDAALFVIILQGDIHLVTTIYLVQITSTGKEDVSCDPVPLFYFA